MPPDTATYRNRIGYGSITPDHSLVRMPSDGSTYAGRKPAGGISQLRSFWPMLLLVLLAVVLLFNTGSFMHSSTSATPEHLTQTIQQLSQNQAAMMQMLQTLSTNSSAPAAGSKQEPGEKAADSPELPAAFAAIPALTKLHNQLLRSSHSYEQHRTVMLQTLERLVHLEPAAAQADIEQQLQESGDLMQQFTCRLYKLLLSTGKLIPCREDSTLVVEDPGMAAGAAGGQHSSHLHLSHLHLWGHNKDQHSTSTSTSSTAKVTKYYFATNLRDNSVNMPQYILSLLQTLLRLPLGSVFVSAYESNSDDGAHGWVDVLQLALNVIGTPSRLVTRGMLVRLEGSNRIQHLARVRNMALAPLYQHYAAARDKAANSNSSSSSGGTGSSGRRRLQADELLLADEADFSSSSSEQSFLQQELDGSSSGSSSSRRRLQTTVQLEAVAAVDDAANLPPGVLPWDPDWIVFVNDAFFCWGMVIRLMNYKADITCGMDFWQNPGGY